VKVTATVRPTGLGWATAMATPTVGVGSQYAYTAEDSEGQWLDGGRTYRVQIQAEAAYRSRPEDLGSVYVRSATGAMVPIGSVANLREDSGPARVVRFNLFPASELQGQAAPGVSSAPARTSLPSARHARRPAGPYLIVDS